MANKPEWADNCPAVISSDGTAEMLGECLQHCESISLHRKSNGRHFAHIYMPNQDLPINRSRNDFRELIVAIQEVLIP